MCATWYLETSADLLRMRQFAAAVEHYARARQLFPSDPEILFCSGVLHERFASTALQAAAESVTESNRTSATVGSARGELVRAERFFRDALVLAAGPCRGAGAARARARRPGAPRRGVGRAAPRDCGRRERWLLYLAQLFLGRAEEALGHDAAARAAFERASALYPNAQSPRLALSQIARRAGNRAAAQRELQLIAALPDDERRREDPWWLYYDVR